MRMGFICVVEVGEVGDIASPAWGSA